MTTQLVGKNCDGGHYTCSPPKECCKQGCCYLLAPVYPPPAIPSTNLFNPLFLGHWYFWLAVTATVAGILCACSLWRRHSQGNLCCRDAGRDERASEPDSNGSCYAPPQYSRCNSFHQAPPPYSEVTSKPDMYPLVISYNGDPVIKNNNSSTGYLMVQYFRNFIIRPVGSLSATSTIDSLSSSFICNAANEANTIIPPPYSCMGSLEEVTTTSEDNNRPNSNQGHLPRSSSLLSGDTNYHQLSQNQPPTSPSAHSDSNSTSSRVVSIRSNPCFNQTATNIVNKTTATVPNAIDLIDEPQSSLVASRTIESQSQTNCDALVKVNNKKILITKIPKGRSQDSESQDEDHNFSDLLNLSVCVPSCVTNLGTPIQSNPHLQELQYSVTNSMTGSDVSSLANLGTPDSPPRATSPTLEMKELLDKIQQLPQQKSPIPCGQNSNSGSAISKSYFHRAKAKTLYMPLHEGTNSSNIRSKSNQKMFSRSWLSRSAPNTPCANFTPTFPVHKKSSCGSGSHKNSRTKISDGSPLLRQHDESDEEATNRDECL